VRFHAFCHHGVIGKPSLWCARWHGQQRTSLKSTSPPSAVHHVITLKHRRSIKAALTLPTPDQNTLLRRINPPKLLIPWQGLRLSNECQMLSAMGATASFPQHTYVTTTGYVFDWQNGSHNIETRPFKFDHSFARIRSITFPP
jgi:hypothetical protein